MIEHPAVARLLADQFGVVATDQLICAGISRRTIVYAQQRGAVEVVLPGVVRAVSHPLTFEGRAMAVQLHTAPHGVLSGPTAARLCGVRQMPIGLTWVMTAQRSRTSVPGWVRRARRAWLDPAADAMTVRGCLRVLRPLPMLVTLSETFNDFRFERAAEDAWHLNLVTPDQAADYVDEIRRQGRRGTSRFQRWLEKTAARTRPSQSGFEMDVLTAIRTIGLPEPERQYPLTLATGELIHLDFAWPDVQLAVEPGHSWWHGGDLKTRADMARDNACGEVGWHVMRYDEAARADLTALGREVKSTYLRRSSFRGRL